jgi:3-hydroxyisobutyrate dehydrogenase-like beta-hydroxyacid dehydrogenase
MATGIAIGWIGLGEMGGRIVRRLLGEGERVVGWNRTRTRAEALEAQGLVVAQTPRAVAERSTVVFTMLTNAQAVQEVVRGEDGILAGLRDGGVLVEMSTIDPDVSRALAREVQDAGGRMLDCPVSGGVGAVATGDLSLMVGGDEATLEAVRPVLDVIGKRVTHIGDNGQALVMKIAINLSLAAQMIAFSEGVLLAEKSGIAREKAVEATLNSAVSSPMLRHRGPAVLEGALPDPAWFNCSMMQKDLLLALALGREVEVPLPTTAYANELMTAGRAMGVGHHDFSVVFHVLARLSGLPDGPA